MNGTSEQTKQSIWHALLSAEHACRYWIRMRDRQMKYGRFLKIAEAISATTLVLISTKQDSFLLIITTIAIAVILSLHIFLPDKSEIVDSVVKDLGNIVNRYALLFEQANEDQISEEEAHSKHELLSAHKTSVTSRAQIDVNSKFSQECQEEAYEVIKNRYAT